MEEYICNLHPNTFIQMDDSIYKVMKVGGMHKTKRRYECSLFHPKNARYDEYKMNAINVFTRELATKICRASTLFKLAPLTKTNCYVVDINDDIITLLTEDYSETTMKVSNIDMCTKINKYLDDADNGDVIITVMTGANMHEIIDVKIVNVVV